MFFNRKKKGEIGNGMHLDILNRKVLIANHLFLQYGDGRICVAVGGSGGVGGGGCFPLRPICHGDHHLGRGGNRRRRRRLSVGPRRHAAAPAAAELAASGGGGGEGEWRRRRRRLRFGRVLCVFLLRGSRARVLARRDTCTAPSARTYH